jgi:hypothetical protein
VDQESPIPTKLPLRTRFLILPGQPDCLFHYSLIRVTAFIYIGRSQPFYLPIYGGAMPEDSTGFVLLTDFRLIPRVRVTLHRYYVHLGHITASTTKCARCVAPSLSDPMTSSNSGAC